MQKEIGSVMALYPTPLTVVGVVAQERVNWLAIAHVGVVDHGHLLVSIDHSHELSNGAIREHGELSVSLITRELLTAADYCGIAKGAKVDKSSVFPYKFGALPYAPIPTNAPLTMACRVIDSIDVKSFTNYILKPEQTYVQEEYLDGDGKVDYEKLSPVLFDMRKGRYFALGEVLGGAWKLGRDYQA